MPGSLGSGARNPPEFDNPVHQGAEADGIHSPKARVAEPDEPLRQPTPPEQRHRQIETIISC